jgi:hypothetical protein
MLTANSVVAPSKSVFDFRDPCPERCRTSTCRRGQQIHRGFPPVYGRDMAFGGELGQPALHRAQVRRISQSAGDTLAAEPLRITGQYDEDFHLSRIAISLSWNAEPGFAKEFNPPPSKRYFQDLST